MLTSQKDPATMTVPSLRVLMAAMLSKPHVCSCWVAVHVPFSAIHAIKMSMPKLESWLENPTTSPWKSMVCSNEPATIIVPFESGTIALTCSLLPPPALTNQPVVLASPEGDAGAGGSSNTGCEGVSMVAGEARKTATRTTWAKAKRMVGGWRSRIRTSRASVHTSWREPSLSVGFAGNP